MIITLAPHIAEKIRQLTGQRIPDEGVDIRRIEVSDPPLMSLEIDGFTTTVWTGEADPKAEMIVDAIVNFVTVFADSVRPEDAPQPEEPEEPEPEPEPETGAVTVPAPVAARAAAPAATTARPPIRPPGARPPRR
jgi:hypothetical protein